MKPIFTTISLSVLIFTATAVKTEAQTTPTAPRGFDYGVKSFTLTYNQQKFIIDSDTLADWKGQTDWPELSSLSWSAPDLQNNLNIFFGLPNSPTLIETNSFHYQISKIYYYVKTTTAGLNIPMQEPAMTITDNKIASFTPPQTGLQIDYFKTTFDIANALERNDNSATVAADSIEPTKNLAQTNSLGINELVAEGTSSFKGSPKNRRFNIAAGVEKMKGILLAPGQKFSFNDYLGPVDGEHGFLPELVIKGNNTIPEFGGGLCQVSTTVFRAAMNAGLPILERRNHAYAVQYYSPQGTDATIYPGSVDLKFTNDTPNYLLIWPYEKDKDTLIFDFYGTKDDRQVTIGKPNVYDRQADGSMKATWARTVVNNGQTKNDVFKSTYQPPALFHHDSQFVSATGTPTSAIPPKLN